MYCGSFLLASLEQKMTLYRRLPFDRLDDGFSYASSQLLSEDDNSWKEQKKGEGGH
jgi:hypothetical protein